MTDHVDRISQSSSLLSNNFNLTLGWFQKSWWLLVNWLKVFLYEYCLLKLTVPKGYSFEMTDLRLYPNWYWMILYDHFINAMISWHLRKVKPSFPCNFLKLLRKIDSNLLTCKKEKFLGVKYINLKFETCHAWYQNSKNEHPIFEFN